MQGWVGMEGLVMSAVVGNRGAVKTFSWLTVMVVVTSAAQRSKGCS